MELCGDLNGKKKFFLKEGIYVYTWLIHFIVNCKAETNTTL